MDVGGEGGDSFLYFYSSDLAYIVDQTIQTNPNDNTWFGDWLGWSLTS